MASFFANQNQAIGLLDPELHTPENVYATSFTLFSVICALGCARSTRPRDKVIYHALLQLAEGNVQWCIAASVMSLETIQAILLMYHWAPLRQIRLSDDPSRLHLSHVSISSAKRTSLQSSFGKLTRTNQRIGCSSGKIDQNKRTSIYCQICPSIKSWSSCRYKRPSTT